MTAPMPEPAPAPVPVPVDPVPNPAPTTGGSLFGIGHWLGTITAHLTDVHLWISIGWLLLGWNLLAAGIVLWLGPSVIGPALRPLVRGAAKL